MLTGFVAQSGTLNAAAALGAVATFALSWAQRSLSTPARLLRRRVARVEGSLVLDDGTVQPIGERDLLAPLERALRALSWAVVALASALVVARLG